MEKEPNSVIYSDNLHVERFELYPQGITNRSDGGFACIIKP